MRTLSPLVASAAIVLLASCSSPEEKLFERKMEARKALDAAYAAYGGGDLLAKAKAEAARSPSKESELAVQLASEADRTFFEGYCLAVGVGDRPFNLSPKLEAWLKDGKNHSLCEKAAKTARKVDELERRTAAKG